MVKIGKKTKDNVEIAYEKAEEMAIEAGAEEVHDEDDECWTLVTSSQDVYSVKGYIEKEKTDVEIVACEVLYKPVVSLPLTDDMVETISNLVDSLSNLHEVNKVWDNVK